ncbi:hypothetical protein D9M71_65010 [compost metagenome]
MHRRGAADAHLRFRPARTRRLEPAARMERAARRAGGGTDRAAAHRPVGGGDAGRPGAVLRRRGAELRRAGRARQPSRPAPGETRRRPGKPRRRGPAAFARLAGVAAGGAQGRWRLRAAGPRLSRRTPALPDAGRRPGLAALRQPRRAPAAAAARRAGHRAGSPRPRCRTSRGAGRGAACAQPRLPDLHLRLHRPAQGRRRGARAAGHALPRDRRALRDGAGRPRTAFHVLRLRRRPRTLADRADPRRQPGAARRRPVDPGTDLRRVAAPWRHRGGVPAGLSAADRRACRRAG